MSLATVLAFFFFNERVLITPAEVMDVTGAKSDSFSNGSCFVPAFGGCVSSWVECCEEGDDEGGFKCGPGRLMVEMGVS